MVTWGKGQNPRLQEWSALSLNSGSCSPRWLATEERLIFTSPLMTLSTSIAIEAVGLSCNGAFNLAGRILCVLGRLICCCSVLKGDTGCGEADGFAAPWNPSLNFRRGPSCTKQQYFTNLPTLAHPRSDFTMVSKIDWGVRRLTEG